MIVKDARFEITAVSPAQYPQSNLPEIAFVGRSNVGKSSIINSLLNRKKLARISGTPGKTREINFYNVNEKLFFVDLPGYGYASVSKQKKSSWGNIIETYLLTRHQLKVIILLVDVRHEPSADDKQMYDWLVANNVPHMVVATKIDKITRSAVNPRLSDIRKALNAAEGIKVFPYSSETRQGREALWEAIDEYVEEE
ncbi:GTP-binding protein [Anaerobacterium chartisolvens]|uniref:Probable GTP-binding protein EngB n=1 Tax=Anaerobacterium chartisolvens TaxID=1297424 RepID=A0A369B542_9FIRM|nr:ribosome biogenesis GTP-binding protein YihA/YsxC [Anaerobacterium chartisolvens]RCX16640.1 GTP-binding protein [Anaerobacterium chartisolvens]